MLAMMGVICVGAAIRWGTRLILLSRENGITSRTADTNVRMYSGETLVIGGLISEEQQRTMQKVPFLSKIPLLGELFKNRSRSHNKTEVLLLLTPHITEAGASPAIYNEGLMKGEGKPQTNNH